jgi:hypothetical protein
MGAVKGASGRSEVTYLLEDESSMFMQDLKTI